MSIPAYFINTPTANGKAPNLLFSDVYTGTVALPAITLVDSILSLPNSGYNFPVRIGQIKSFDFFPYAAGTLGNYTLGLGAVVPVKGQVYKWQIISGDGSYNQTGIAIAPSTVVADLVTAVNTSMTNANGGGYFTHSIVGTGIVVVETATTTKGLTILFSDANATYTVNVANAPAFGTVAQVQLYKPSVTSGTFNLYQWAVEVNVENFEGTSTHTKELVYIQVWMDTGATNYATANTQLKQFGNGGTYWSATYSVAQMKAMNNVPK